MIGHCKLVYFILAISVWQSSALNETRIIKGPEIRQIAVGNSVTFFCSAVTDSSLTLQIDWLKNGEPIKFDQGSRFARDVQNSLTISRTELSDGGIYTCVAKTEVDETSANAGLTVQDVPNPPNLDATTCNGTVATIEWMSTGENYARILFYTVQFNTSFTPDLWETVYDRLSPAEWTSNIAMSNWASYTFRVIAWNKVGPSRPSAISEVCTTEAAVPHKNPDRVEGKGTEPGNLVITWNAMPEIEHNGPDFYYHVFYKRDIPGEEYTKVDIADWEQTKLIVPNLPTYQQYRIKVMAANALGWANESAVEVIGYSGEDAQRN